MSNLLGELSFFGKRLRETAREWRAHHHVLRRHPTASIDRSVRIVSHSRLELGERVMLQAGVVLHCGGLAWSNGQGRICIGSDSVISPYCVLYGAGALDIGHHFDCGPGVMIFSSRSVFEADARAAGREHHFAPVSIGNHVIIFSGAIISPGVRVGDGAVIGAGAVVLRDVASGAFVAGVPSRPLHEQ